MKEKAMQSMSTLSSAQIVAGLPHPAYHHTVHFVRMPLCCFTQKTPLLCSFEAWHAQITIGFQFNNMNDVALLVY